MLQSSDQDAAAAEATHTTPTDPAANETPTEPPATETPKTPRLRGRRLLTRVSIQSKLLLLLLVCSIASVAVVGIIGYQSGRSSLRASVFDRLTQVRETQSRQLKAKLADLQNSLILYSRASTTVDALTGYTAGFNQLSAAPITPQQQQGLVDYYTNQFIKTAERNSGTKLDLDALLPTSNAERYLQAHYTAPFTSPDQAVKLDDARDGSDWSAVNAHYNAFFRAIVERFRYKDLLLLDGVGNVVYSANKGVDLGSNIFTGPYRESNLRDAYQKATASNAVDFVAVTDYHAYLPAADQPTAWMVAPVGAAGHIDGAVALGFPITGLNNLMTVDKQWQANGFGNTGESYIAGPDDVMRSDSRLFLEDPAAYKREAVAAGTPPDVVDEAVRLGGTVMVQPVSTVAVRAAQRGQSGTLIATDYLGHETLQAYAPADLGSNLHWSIIAKIDTAEAFAPERSFTQTLVLSTAAIIFVVCIAAMFIAHLFVRPMRRLEAGAQRISAGEYDVAIPVKSRDEIGDLTMAFNEMSRTLTIKEELLNEQRRENDRLLLSLMPESIVERYRRGEEVIALDHRDVTVIFADFVGLDQLQASLTSEESLAIVNELIRQIDAAAENLGVERVRTVHNGYLASCGLTVPRLDNVRRTVDFALEMARIIGRFNSETGHHLEVRAGIDTGTVSSGLVGSVVYDMWGAAVNLAYQVQSGTTQPGIYVSSAVYEAMADTRHFSPAGTTTVDGSEQPVWRLSERQP